MSAHPEPQPLGAGVDDLARALRRLEQSRGWLSSRLDASAAGSELLKVLVEATASSRASLLVTNPHTGRLRILAAFGLPPDIVGHDLEHARRRISDWVLRERRTLLLNGEVRDRRFDGSVPHEVESALCLPLVGDGGAIGVLNLSRGSADRPFAPADLATGEHLARALSAALEQVLERQAAEWSWRRLRAAGQGLQRTEGLLQARRWQIAATQIPCPLVAGDVRERLVHPDGSQTVLVADVAGRGVEAVARAALLQGLFAGLGRGSASPAELARRMNAELCRRLGPGGLATAWLATLSPSGQLASCTAGAAPPWWVPFEGDAVRRLDVGGPLLGAIPDAGFDEQDLRLLPGDAVTAVTDGVLGARDAAGDAFGPERVEELAVEHRRQPLDRLAERVAHAALAHQGTARPVDDLTVFALRYSRDL